MLALGMVISGLLRHLLLEHVGFPLRRLCRVGYGRVDQRSDGGGQFGGFDAQRGGEVEYLRLDVVPRLGLGLSSRSLGGGG